MSENSPFPKAERDKILALVQYAKGDAGVAEKLLTAAAMKDHNFLLALAKPFMKGIIKYAIDHVRGVGPMPAAPPPSSAPASRDAAGRAAMPYSSTAAKSLYGKSNARTGLIREEQLSESDKKAHADNLKALAAAFKKKN